MASMDKFRICKGKKVLDGKRRERCGREDLEKGLDGGSESKSLFHEHISADLELERRA